MKTQKLLFATIWTIIGIAFFACNEENVDPNLVGVDTPSIATNNSALFGDNSVRDRVRGSGIGGPMGLIYGRLTSTANGRSGLGVFETNRAMMSSRADYSNARIASDSTEVQEPEEEVTPSCWVETYTETENTYEYTLDFGDGCVVDGEFLKGKMIERGTFSEGKFSDEVEYFSFGGEDWEISGTETYEGTWAEHEEDSAIWEAAYQFTSNLTERHEEEDEVVEVDFRASGAEEIDNAGLTVSSGEEFVSTSTGETYESRIEEPLYLDFNCEEDEVFVFVRGLEIGEYSYQEDELTVTGTFSIDFGDGNCDNIVIVTEDGVSEEIDVAEEWEDEHECEEEHNED